MRFGYSRYFFEEVGCIIGKFNDFVLGTFNDLSFACCCKSGSQNLWLPFKQDIGLKVLHPTRFSGGLEKANAHYKAQELLAEEELAPRPFEMLEVKVSCVDCGIILSPEGQVVLKHTKNLVVKEPCYGIMMERVRAGTVTQILQNLQLFNIENKKETRAVVESFIKWYGSDALTLHDYAIFCRFFGVSEKEHLNEIISDLKGRIPPVFSKAPDLLSPANVVLNENGEAKVVDFDLSGI